MEELRSTEILDREIEADASKKSKKIIEKAEKQAQEILDGVDERVKENLDKKRESYKEKLQQIALNSESFIPLEKERMLASFYEEQVCASLNNYFDSIGKEKRLLWLEKKLLKVKTALNEQPANFFYFGDFEEKEISDFAKKHFASKVNKITKINFEQSHEEKENGNNFHEGIIIESENKCVKVRLTMDEIVREIKDKYSEKLAVTLFGGRL